LNSFNDILPRHDAADQCGQRMRSAGHEGLYVIRIYNYVLSTAATRKSKFSAKRLLMEQGDRNRRPDPRDDSDQTPVPAPFRHHASDRYVA